MKRLTILGIIACLGLLVGSAAVIGKPAGPPGGLDVNVVSPDPLPVTGEVDANVTGDTANPVPVRIVSSIPKQPVILSESDTFSEGNVEVRVEMFTVPAGKCLIVEYVTAEAVGAGKLNVNLLQIVWQTEEGSFGIPIDFFQTGAGSVPAHLVSKLVRLYMPSEAVVSGRARISPTTGNGTVFFKIHGHLVDLE